jgi:hypothetical protein
MQYVYGGLCFLFGLVNLRLVRDEIRDGETRFHLSCFGVKTGENRNKFTWVIVGQCVLSFVMFLVGMYWFNPQ